MPYTQQPFPQLPNQPNYGYPPPQYGNSYGYPQQGYGYPQQQQPQVMYVIITVSANVSSFILVL